MPPCAMRERTWYRRSSVRPTSTSAWADSIRAILRPPTIAFARVDDIVSGGPGAGTRTRTRFLAWLYPQASTSTNFRRYVRLGAQCVLGRGRRCHGVPYRTADHHSRDSGQGVATRYAAWLVAAGQQRRAGPRPGASGGRLQRRQQAVRDRRRPRRAAGLRLVPLGECL